MNKLNNEQTLTIQQNPPSTGDVVSHEDSLKTQQIKQTSKVAEDSNAVMSELKPNYES